MSYPQLLLEEQGVEIIACSPFRFRVLYEGKFVRTFKFYTSAALYVMQEFITLE